MGARTKQNPFQLLGLPIGASNEEIVDRGQELCELAETEEKMLRFREAMDALLHHPLTRRLHELLEVPGTAYHDEEWERFARRNRRKPVNLAPLEEVAHPLRTEDFDLRAIVGLLLDGLLSPPAADIRPALENPPVLPGRGAAPVEVSDVIFG